MNNVHLSSYNGDQELVRVVTVDREQWESERAYLTSPPLYANAINAAYALSDALLRDDLVDSLTVDITVTADNTAHIFLSDMVRADTELSPAESVALATYSRLGVGDNIVVHIPGITDSDVVAVKTIADVQQVADDSAGTGTSCIQVTVNNDPTGDIQDYTMATQLLTRFCGTVPWEFRITGTYDETRGFFVNEEDKQIFVLPEILDAAQSVISLIHRGGSNGDFDGSPKESGD
jgi:hypothetical protein